MKMNLGDPDLAPERGLLRLSHSVLDLLELGFRCQQA